MDFIYIYIYIMYNIYHIYDIFTWNLGGNKRLVKVHNKGLRNLYTSLNIKPVSLSEIKAERTVARVARITQDM